MQVNWLWLLVGIFLGQLVIPMAQQWLSNTFGGSGGV